MDKIKILSDQYNDGLLTDREYMGRVFDILADLFEECREDNSNTEVQWLANRLAMATGVSDA